MNLLSFVCKHVGCAIFLAVLLAVTSSGVKATETINWAHLPGGITDIAIGANGWVWGVSPTGSIYAWRNGKWGLIAGKGVGKRIAVDPRGRAWIVKPNKQILRQTGRKKFELFHGSANDIAIGTSGKLWVIGTNKVSGGYSISRLDGNGWKKIHGGGTRIAVDPVGNAWIISSDHTIWRYDGSKFNKMPGLAIDIAIGAEGSVWIVGQNHSPYRFNGKDWTKYSGTAVAIAADSNGMPWHLNSANRVYADKRSGSVKDKFVDAGEILESLGLDRHFQTVVAKSTTPKVPAGYALANKCGGAGQHECTTSAAMNHGKSTRSKPTSRSFYDIRNGGEWWECPADRPRRTLYGVTESRACATTTFWPGEKLSHAIFRGAKNVPKPKGTFLDIGRSEYWSCPTDYSRNLNPVTDKASCTINLGHACDSGNIDVKGLCYKKGVCGAKGQRPCLLVEHIPSCKNKLVEDFKDNICITQKMAQCLTFARGLRLVKNSPQAKVAKIGGEIFAHTPAGMTFDLVSKGISAGMSEMSSKQKQQLAKYKAGGGDTNNIVYKAAKTMTDIESKIPEIMRYVKKASTNSDKLLGVLSADRVCTDSAKVTGAKLHAIMGKPDPKIMKAELDFLDGLFIKSANAATGHFFLTFSVGAELDEIIAGALGLTVATDFRGKWGLYFDKSVGVITNVGGSGGLSLGFYPKATLDTFSGKGWAISGSAGPPSKAIGGGVSFIINEAFNDVQGFAIDVAVGASVSPVDLSITHSESDTIVKTP